MSQALCTDAEYLTVSDAVRVAAGYEVYLTPAAIKVAADAGRLHIAARTRKGTRLFRLEDVEAFARARASAGATK
jgi:hypothetical protein